MTKEECIKRILAALDAGRGGMILNYIMSPLGLMFWLPYSFSACFVNGNKLSAIAPLRFGIGMS